MTKTILILSDGPDAVDTARRAHDMGFHVVVSDADPESPAFEFADSRLIANVLGDGETAAAAARYDRKIRKIDGVISVGVNAPVTLATVAERLGLRGISIATAEALSDKLAMKARLVEAGVPVPWFASVSTPQELQRLAVERGRHLVVKPVDSRDGQGVQRVAAAVDLTKAFMLARTHSPTDRVMVEQYLDGPRVSTESIVVDGQCYTPVFSDRSYEDLDRTAPFIVENGGDLPSCLPDEMQARVRDLVARAARALGIANGPVRAEVVVHKGEPHMLDLSVCLPGGVFCAKEIPLGTGVDFAGTALKVAVGEPVAAEELQPVKVTPVVQRHVFADPGRVVSINGVAEARWISGVADVIVTARPGDMIPPGATQPVATVLATGASHGAALKAANDALGCLKIVTQ